MYRKESTYCCTRLHTKQAVSVLTESSQAGLSLAHEQSTLES